MYNSEAFLNDMQPYALPQVKKEIFLLERVNELALRHMNLCEEYGNLLHGMQSFPPYGNLKDVPMIPTTIFKEFQLISRSNERDKIKAIHSSSTSSGVPSQVFVDDQTALRQKKSVQLIFDSYLSTQKRPYIIFDAIETARGKNSLSARGAAIMSLMGYADQFYFVMDLVNGELVLNHKKLADAIKHAGESGQFIAYGFTYILYLAHKEMARNGISYKGFGENSYIIHSGGWKKLQYLAVNKDDFNNTISEAWGISSSQVIDFYGLVEQAGIIYPDCSSGNKHVPYYADIMIRSPYTLEPLQIGETGLIQLISALPLSSPTHSILTDDLGEITAIDTCACGRKGKAFRFKGRAPKAEVRGCGDVYAGERSHEHSRL